MNDTQQAEITNGQRFAPARPIDDIFGQTIPVGTTLTVVAFTSGTIVDADGDVRVKGWMPSNPEDITYVKAERLVESGYQEGDVVTIHRPHPVFTTGAYPALVGKQVRLTRPALDADGDMHGRVVGEDVEYAYVRPEQVVPVEVAEQPVAEQPSQYPVGSQWLVKEGTNANHWLVGQTVTVVTEGSIASDGRVRGIGIRAAGPGGDISDTWHADSEWLAPLTDPMTDDERRQYEDRLANMEENVRTAQAGRVEAVRRHEADIAAIGEALQEKANDRGWCDEYDDFVGDLNGSLHVALPVRTRTYDVEVTLTREETQTITVEVEARNAQEAVEQVNDMEEGDLFDKTDEYGWDTTTTDVQVNPYPEAQ